MTISDERCQDGRYTQPLVKCEIPDMKNTRARQNGNNLEATSTMHTAGQRQTRRHQTN